MISPSKGYFSKEWYNILWLGQIYIFYILWLFFLINSFDALIIFIFLSKVTAVSLYLFRFIKEDTMYFIVNELYLCVLHPNLIEYTADTKSQNANTKCVYYIIKDRIMEKCITGYSVMDNCVHSTWKSKVQLSHIL